MGMMLLPIELTEAERLIVLSDLSTKLMALEALTEEKKAIPERIKSLMGAINHLNHSIATNTVEREVEVREEPNAFGGTVKIFRVDTGAFVKERPMDPDERQLRLGDTPVPVPTPDNVRSLDEARARTEEQNTAATPEEAEEQRNARLVEEHAQRSKETIEQLMAAATVEMRGTEGYIASVPAAPGLASGHAGPIRATPEEARDELRSELARLLAGTAPSQEALERAAEIEKLTEEQAADAAKDGPKTLLQAPKGKGKKGKKTAAAEVEKGLAAEATAAEAVASNPNGVDTTPPPGAAF